MAPHGGFPRIFARCFSVHKFLVFEHCANLSPLMGIVFFFCLFFVVFVVAVWLLVGLPPCLFCLSASLRSVAFVLCSCSACFARFFCGVLAVVIFLASLGDSVVLFFGGRSPLFGLRISDPPFVCFGGYSLKYLRCLKYSDVRRHRNFFAPDDFLWILCGLWVLWVVGCPVACFCLPVPGGNRLFPRKQLISSGDK